MKFYRNISPENVIFYIAHRLLVAATAATAWLKIIRIVHLPSCDFSDTSRCNLAQLHGTHTQTCLSLFPKPFSFHWKQNGLLMKKWRKCQLSSKRSLTNCGVLSQWKCFYQNESCLSRPHPPLSYEERSEQGRQLSFWRKALNLMAHYTVIKDQPIKSFKKTRETSCWT